MLNIVSCEISHIASYAYGSKMKSCYDVGRNPTSISKLSSIHKCLGIIPQHLLRNSIQKKCSRMSNNLSLPLQKVFRSLIPRAHTSAPLRRLQGTRFSACAFAHTSTLL